MTIQGCAIPAMHWYPARICSRPKGSSYLSICSYEVCGALKRFQCGLNIFQKSWGFHCIMRCNRLPRRHPQTFAKKLSHRYVGKGDFLRVLSVNPRTSAKCRLSRSPLKSYNVNPQALNHLNPKPYETSISLQVSLWGWKILISGSYRP